MVLENLKPSIFWDIFENILTKTPRPSKHEEKIREKIKDWVNEQVKTKDLRILLKEEEVGNILIKKQPSQGCEDWPSILLQAHLDMVCETDRKERFDFFTQPIPVRIQDNREWVDADGTTLGADNGVGVALALSMLIDEESLTTHGPIEVLLTVNEEDGFDGANYLDPQNLGIESKLMINLDSGPLGILTIGSVCGGRVNFSQEFAWKDINNTDLSFFELKVSGLLGGHSGGDIHLTRGNANKFITRILLRVREELSIFIGNWAGGTKANVIPKKSVIVFGISSSQEDKCSELVRETTQEIYNYYKNPQLAKTLEPNLDIAFSKVDPEPFLSVSDSDKVIALMSLIPNEVLRFSPFYEDTVETSNNLAIINREANKFNVWLYPRSIIRSEMKNFRRAMVQLGKLGNWEINLLGILPEWNPKPGSPFLRFVKEYYEKIIKNQVETKIIHGGLETGAISEKIPEIDIVSLSPTIEDVHSTRERVKISDVKLVYKVLVEIIKNLDQLR